MTLKCIFLGVFGQECIKFAAHLVLSCNEFATGSVFNHLPSYKELFIELTNNAGYCSSV